MHKFTKEQAEFIRNNVVGRSNVELTQLFNIHFSINLKVTQIAAYKKNHKLSSGLDGRFKPGQTPFNKGKKKYWVGGEQTQFKKGNKPHNYKPVGTERVNGDGYVDIKVADPNKWRGKHILIWEEHNGPVPKGHAIIFGDRNNRNFDPDNLICVTKGQLATLNVKGLIKDNADLTRIGVAIADIHQSISKKTKKQGS